MFREGNLKWVKTNMPLIPEKNNDNKKKKLYSALYLFNEKGT